MWRERAEEIEHRSHPPPAQALDAAIRRLRPWRSWLASPNTSRNASRSSPCMTSWRARSPMHRGVTTWRRFTHAIDQLRRDGHLVDAIRSRGGPSLVTDRALRAEREVIRRMKEGAGKTEVIVPVLGDREEARGHHTHRRPASGSASHSRRRRCSRRCPGVCGHGQDHDAARGGGSRRHGERHRPCPLVECGAHAGPRGRHRRPGPCSGSWHATANPPPTQQGPSPARCWWWTRCRSPALRR